MTARPGLRGPSCVQLRVVAIPDAVHAQLEGGVLQHVAQPGRRLDRHAALVFLQTQFAEPDLSHAEDAEVEVGVGATLARLHDEIESLPLLHGRAVHAEALRAAAEVDRVLHRRAGGDRAAQTHRRARLDLVRAAQRDLREVADVHLQGLAELRVRRHDGDRRLVAGPGVVDQPGFPLGRPIGQLLEIHVADHPTCPQRRLPRAPAGRSDRHARGRRHAVVRTFIAAPFCRGDHSPRSGRGS